MNVSPRECSCFSFIYLPWTFKSVYSRRREKRRRKENCWSCDTRTKPCLKWVFGLAAAAQCLQIIIVVSEGSKKDSRYSSRSGAQHFEHAKHRSCHRKCSNRKHWSSHTLLHVRQRSDAKGESAVAAASPVVIYPPPPPRLFASSTSWLRNLLIAFDFWSIDSCWRNEFVEFIRSMNTPRPVKYQFQSCGEADPDQNFEIMSKARHQWQ